MKRIVLFLSLFISAQVFSQRTLPQGTHVFYGEVFDAKKMQHPPIYPFGQDSLLHYYYAHFAGFDSVLTKAIANGDTAKYIRVYFSFVIDRDGTPGDPHFRRVASTEYAKSATARTIKYFDDDKAYFDEVIKKMVHKMGFWKPGLANLANSGSMVAADARVEDYIQFWVGINPPAN